MKFTLGSGQWTVCVRNGTPSVCFCFPSCFLQHIMAFVSTLVLKSVRTLKNEFQCISVRKDRHCGHVSFLNKSYLHKILKWGHKISTEYDAPVEGHVVSVWLEQTFHIKIFKF